MKLLEELRNAWSDMVDRFRALDDRHRFIGFVMFLVFLRLVGEASLSVFMALIYIMWYVSTGKR